MGAVAGARAPAAAGRTRRPAASDPARSAPRTGSAGNGGRDPERGARGGRCVAGPPAPASGGSGGSRSAARRRRLPPARRRGDQAGVRGAGPVDAAGGRSAAGRDAPDARRASARAVPPRLHPPRTGWSTTDSGSRRSIWSTPGPTWPRPIWPGWRRACGPSVLARGQRSWRVTERPTVQPIRTPPGSLASWCWTPSRRSAGRPGTTTPRWRRTDGERWRRCWTRRARLRRDPAPRACAASLRRASLEA